MENSHKPIFSKFEEKDIKSFQNLFNDENGEISKYQVKKQLSEQNLHSPVQHGGNQPLKKKDDYPSIEEEKKEPSQKNLSQKKIEKKNVKKI